MSNKQNDKLMDQAFDLALEVCDPTCPPEIVMEKAKELYLLRPSRIGYVNNEAQQELQDSYIFSEEMI